MAMISRCVIRYIFAFVIADYIVFGVARCVDWWTHCETCTAILFALGREVNMYLHHASMFNRNENC